MFVSQEGKHSKLGLGLKGETLFLCDGDCVLPSAVPPDVHPPITGFGQPDDSADDSETRIAERISERMAKTSSIGPSSLKEYETMYRQSLTESRVSRSTH